MDIQFFKKLSFPKFNLFGRASQSVIGIDFGTSSIKIVQLKKEKERAFLETYGALATGPYANLSVGQTSHLSDEKTIELIQDLFKEIGAKTKDVGVTVPLRNTFITTINLPPNVKDNLQEIVSIEARKYVPLPISEIVLDWWLIPPALEQGKEGLEGKKQILLVAIHKESIENYKSILSRAGLNARLFEIEIFSTIRSCISREVSPVLIMDIGASGTKMAIVDYGIVRLVHHFDKGSQDLTLALSSSLSVDFLRAEEMKQEIGLSSRPEHKEIVSAMEPLLGYIFSEGSRFAADYRRRNNRSVTKAILTGGGSLLKGAVDFAVKSLGIEVSLADPFLKTEYPAFLQPVLKAAGPTFSASLGAALRGLQSL